MIAYSLWPHSFRQPKQTIKIIYLDLNHWISLSKARSGHHDGKKYENILAACCNSSLAGTAVFPLSVHLCMEIEKIRKYRQRCDLREILEEVSRFKFVPDRVLIATHEIEALLDLIKGPNPQPIKEVDFLCFGLLQALGVDSIPQEFDREDDISKAQRSHFCPEGLRVFNELALERDTWVTRRAIEGPSPAEEPEHRKAGWRPEYLASNYRQNAKVEALLDSKLNEVPTLRNQPTLQRDIISAFEIYFELNAILKRGCNMRGVSHPESLFPEKEYACAAFESMPSFDVVLTLKNSLHRNAQHRWRNNDIYDIQALATTIPYCDVVMTDKTMAEHAKRSGLAKRMNTLVLSNLLDLLEHL